MRVVAGTARGIKLRTIEEMTTRPTIDRVKENMFNIIGLEVRDAVVTDFFSGSGALCIEALSRGAREAYLVELNPKCIPVITENLNKTRLADKATIENIDFETFAKKSATKKLKFDIIFLDPPHNKGLGYRSMELIDENNLLSENGMIVVEHHSNEMYLDRYAGLVRYKFKKYGNTSLSFYTTE